MRSWERVTDFNCHHGIYLKLRACIIITFRWPGKAHKTWELALVELHHLVEAWSCGWRLKLRYAGINQCSISNLVIPASVVVKTAGLDQFKTDLKLFDPVTVRPVCLTCRSDYGSQFRHIWASPELFISGPVHGSARFGPWIIHLSLFF